jgi:hypothetical protein
MQARPGTGTRWRIAFDRDAGAALRGGNAAMNETGRRGGAVSRRGSVHGHKLRDE